jgi:hypothetical protein
MMKGLWWNALMVSTVWLGALGCSVADKEVEEQSPLEALEGFDFRGAGLLQPQPPPPAPGPVRTEAERVEEQRKRKAFRQELRRRLDISREAKRVGGQGQIEDALVTKVFRRHRARMSDCYERIARGAPDLHGQVEVRFTIALNGRVEEAEITGNTTQSEPLGICITSRILRLRFPVPQGGVVAFSWTMELAPPKVSTE